MNNTELAKLPSISAVYLLTNKYKRILYIGSAQDLKQRWFHNYRKNNGTTNIKIRDYLKQNASLTNKHYLYYCELKSNIEVKTIESLLIGIIETELNSEWQ